MELLVVISIIAVLSAVLMVNFVGTRERSRDSQKIQDLNSLKGALRMYYNDKQQYPVESGECTAKLSSYLKTDYFPGIGATIPGCTYESTDGNTFVLKVTLDSGAGNDDIDSQLKCGLSEQIDKLYAVCAK